MNNEPVAWMWEREINGLARETLFLTYRPWNENAIPLYIHPAKTLTDEEIIKVIEQVECTYDPAEIETSYDYEFRVAKAILRKAQEK
jgi:hypothetical protein